MATCTYCGSETDLHEGGVPICLECVNNGSDRRKPLIKKIEESVPPEKKKNEPGTGELK